MGKQILVADLDPMTPMYKVVDETGRSIGRKNPRFGYMKPEYQKNGRQTGGNRGGIDALLYKGTPPWLRCEVFQIDNPDGHITFHVRKRGSADNG